MVTGRRAQARKKMVDLVLRRRMGMEEGNEITAVNKKAAVTAAWRMHSINGV